MAPAETVHLQTRGAGDRPGRLTPSAAACSMATTPVFGIPSSFSMDEGPSSGILRGREGIGPLFDGPPYTGGVHFASPFSEAAGVDDLPTLSSMPQVRSTRRPVVLLSKGMPVVCLSSGVVRGFDMGATSSLSRQ